MSPKTMLRSGLAILVITAAACSEPLAPKLERIQSQIANALTCTISWSGLAGDNMWQTPGNWAPPRLPTASDNVCITSDGAAVELFGDAGVNSVTIGTSGSSNPATLHVRGFRQGTGWFNLPANLNAASGIDVFGILSMDASGFGPGAVTLNVSGSGIAVHSGGIFRSLSKDFDAGGGNLVHYVNASVLNEGTLDWRTSVEMRGGYINHGVARLQQNWRNWESGYFYNLPGGVWYQENGTLIVDGVFTITDGQFLLTHGTITGSDGPVMERGSLVILNGSTATGNVTLRNTVTLHAANVPAGLTIIAAGHAYSTTGINFATTVTAGNGFVNRGTIRLISTGHAGGTPSVLAVTNGVIDNYGRIESHVGGGDKGRQINASITNRAGALIEIKTPTDFNKAGAAYENHGTITVTPSTFVTLNGAPSFLQNGALTLGTDAQWQQNGGSFRLAGGAVTGRPWLAATTFDIPAGSAATGTFKLTHPTPFTGDVPAGVKLHVEATRGFGSQEGVLSAAASYTNFGTIVLGEPAFNPTPARLAMLNGSTLTNKGRIETTFDQAGGHRYITGNVINEGTLQLDNWTQFNGTVRSLAPAAVTMGSTGQGLFDLQPGATLIASGTWPVQLVNRGNLHIGATGTAAALHLKEYSGASSSSVTVDIGGSPTAPGVDFDKLSMTGPMTIGNGTMHVKALSPCVDGGNSYDVIAYSHPSGNFANFTGLDLGNDRTVQPVQLSTGYRLSVVGPVCPPPLPPPTVDAIVTGTMGNNGWYVSDVTVEWKAEHATSHAGCEDQRVTDDTGGVTYTCTATNATGSATKSVTIKRDATPPVVSASRSPAPNANGWNNTDVTATTVASDAMSGLLLETGTGTYVFASEGANQSITYNWCDRAGNCAGGSFTGVNIDKTAPIVTVTRSPAPDASGWNDTDVTATWNATDALSGIAGSSTATMLFDQDGANQSGSRTFSDLAGNSAGATIANINIDKTPAPPPPPPPTTITPVCSVTPSEIWPANNKPVRVNVSVGGSGVTSFKLRSVTNNESGTADVEGWAIGTADVEGYVLAKRNGNGSGRTYTLTYDVFGANGATGSCAVTVRVPHDQRR